jgi:UDP-N-acetyl-2-amino-2-deoxyglucuronate dehydrogenase
VPCAAAKQQPSNWPSTARRRRRGHRTLRDMKNFAITGVAGFVAPRHIRAIRDTGNNLVAALDPHDSVGVLDSYFPSAAFFTEYERFDRHLERLRRGAGDSRVSHVTICAPNHLHDAHIRLALRIGADAICEKPLVLNPWNLDALAELEAETGQHVYTVLQLRVHPVLQALKQELIDRAASTNRSQVVLTYITSRGPWYQYSWKGNPEKSGGLPTNIGIHFFDLLSWLFGPLQGLAVHVAEPRRWAGFLSLERADVRWYLSIDSLDLALSGGTRSTVRSITIDGRPVDFSEGFSDLHTKLYEETLAGRGFGLNEARPSIELVHRIRYARLDRGHAPRHPYLDNIREVR